MALPLLMPLFIATSVIGTAASALGAIQQSNATAKAARFNAQIANENATAAAQERAMQSAQFEREQSIIKDQTAREAESRRDKALRFSATQRNAMIASGGSMSGSGLELINDTDVQQELDVKNVEYNGLMRAWEKNYQSRISDFSKSKEIRSFQLQSQLETQKAKSAQSSLLPSLIGIGAQGASSLAFGMQNFRKS
jgi:hypothetical protein